MLKSRVFLILFVASFIFSSCEKLNELTTFRMNMNTEFTIKANPVMGGLPVLETPEISTSSEQAFSNNNTRADLVEEAMLESLVLEITMPESQSFNFLKSIEIFIKADGLDEVQLAQRHEIPESINHILELETTEENLLEYIKKDSYSLVTKVVTDKTLNKDVDIDAQMRFRIKAKVF